MINICWYKRITSDYQSSRGGPQHINQMCETQILPHIILFCNFQMELKLFFICVLVEKRSSGTQMILIFRYFHFIYIYMFVFIFIIIACELEIVSWWKRRTLTNFGERLLFLSQQSYQPHKWIHLAHLFVCYEIVGGCWWHTWYLSFFLHRQNFWRIKFTQKKHVNCDKIHSKLPIFCVVTSKDTVNCQFFALNL